MEDDNDGMSTAAPRGGERWKHRATQAEAHNERVQQMLTKYVVRNQLMMPRMPACVLMARNPKVGGNELLSGF